jgi:hypothetical protein
MGQKLLVNQGKLRGSLARRNVLAHFSTAKGGDKKR